jgi:SAM-dependent methyltransferase
MRIASRHRAMRFDPIQWARVHDERPPAQAAFWRGLELCQEMCAPALQAGKVWADLGAGTGHLSKALVAGGARPIGIDHDLGMALYARRRWRTGNCVAAVDTLPLAAGSCAGAVAISLLGCLSSPRSLFREAARVLAPDGILCVSAMNRGSWLLTATKAAAWRGWRSESPRYVAYDPGALAAELEELGLEPERQIFYAAFLTIGRWALPAPERAPETEVSPGSRSVWARQFLLLARRNR